MSLIQVSVCLIASSMATTDITEIGLRETIKRLIASTDMPVCCTFTTTSQRSEDAYLYREDGRHLTLCVVRHRSNNKNIYEILLSWHDLDEVEDDMSQLSPFLVAMDRFMGFNRTETLAYTNEQVCMEGARHHQDAIPCMRNVINRALQAQLCSCEKHMIADDWMVCLTCTMALTEEDMAMHVCGVCKEGCKAPIMKTPCCSQYIHKACWKKCNGSCPFCRASQP